MVPSRLYKYLPSKWATDVMDKGHLLFRNLTFFQQYEDQQRGDPLEGHHRDNPKHGAQVAGLASGKLRLVRGSFSFINSTNPDLIYVFCLSRIWKEDFFKEFTGSDACIEIREVEEFLSRVRRAVVRRPSTHRSGLLHGDAKYYAGDEPCDFNPKDTQELVFAKPSCFAHQREYRLVFGMGHRAFRLEQAISDNRRYDFRREAARHFAKERLIVIGGISDIAVVRYAGETS